MQAPSPIIVRVVEEQELATLGAVIVRAIGLTGALSLGALVLGLGLAGLFIGYRKLTDRSRTDEDAAQTQSLGLTPPSRK